MRAPVHLLATAVPALVTLLIAAACSAGSPATAESAPRPATPGVERVASPDGDGDACTAAAPCSVEAAMAASGSGDAVLLEPGDYRDLLLATTGADAGFDDNVVVTSATPGDPARLRGTTVIRGSHVTLRGAEVRGTLRTDAEHPVAHLVLEDLDVVNGTVFLNGVRDAVLRDSTFRDGVNRDAINVKDGSSEVLLEGNVVDGYVWDPEAGGAEVHIDCVQAFGVHGLVLRGNQFRDCSQRALILQVAGTADTVDVTIENNYFGPCTSEPCQNVETPFQATGEVNAEAISSSNGSTGRDYRIVNNTIHGYAFVEPVPGLVFANNIIERFFNTEGRLACGVEGERHNLVAELAQCADLGPGSRLGQPQFLGQSWELSPDNGVDLGFADASLAPDTDALGRRPCGARDVGALEVGCDANDRGS